MTKDEIKELLKQIKVVYPRFEGVNRTEGGFAIDPAVVDAWYRRLGYMDYERALEILDRYMESEDGKKTPTIAIWLSGGRRSVKASRTTMFFDRMYGTVLWTPEEGVRYEIPVSWNPSRGAWEDADGRLYAIPGEE